MSVEPFVYTTETAATVCGLATRGLVKLRQDSAKLLAEGKPIVGPMWIRINQRIYYRPADLQKWIDAQAVECGIAVAKNPAYRKAVRS